MRVKNILITQPKPETDKSPYFDLAKKFNVKIDFQPFIKVEPVAAKEFRQEKINIQDYTSVIFTSRNAIDQFFRMCGEMRMSPQESMKYFCLSDSIAYYLQKYVVFRKRKIFFGKQTIEDLIEIMNKHNGEKFLVPSADIQKQRINEVLEENKIKFKRAVMYKTVCSELGAINIYNYDILVFFSPLDVKSLIRNFPKFRQNNTRIAAFGPTVSKAVSSARLRLDIMAPMPGAPSMPMVLAQYLKKVNR